MRLAISPLSGFRTRQLLKPNTKVLRCTNQWITDKAITMITGSIQDQSVTTWVEAADSHHVQRTKRRMTADHALAGLRKLNVPSFTQLFFNHRKSKYIRRLEIILTKLHPHPIQRSEISVLTKHEVKVAKDRFEKIAFAACVGCPETDYLALGTEGVVQHSRECHPNQYWKKDWMLSVDDPLIL